MMEKKSRPKEMSVIDAVKCFVFPLYVTIYAFVTATFTKNFIPRHLLNNWLFALLWVATWLILLAWSGNKLLIWLGFDKPLTKSERTDCVQVGCG